MVKLSELTQSRYLVLMLFERSWLGRCSGCAEGCSEKGLVN